VIVEEGQISLTISAGSAIDFEDFEAACQRQEWQAALELYKGDFLTNYLYAEWTVLPRQRLAYLYQQALLIQAEIWLEKQEYRQALQASEQVLALEPWQEKATLVGMKSCLASGDRAGARRIYRRLKNSLKEELKIQPTVELQRLYKSI
jgi:DNA-binding SARP family transcriptional activator